MTAWFFGHSLESPGPALKRQKAKLFKSTAYPSGYPIDYKRNALARPH